MSPTVINYVEEYFHTLNPLAKRIIEEINHTRDAYETLWDGLTVPEQRQIVDEAIIRPEAVLKYSRSSLSRELSVPEVFPTFRIQTGAKYVVYEDGTTGKGIKWRDEHSAPFSWLTRSQQDLRIFGSTDPLPATNHKKMSKSSTPVRRAKPPAPPAPELHMDPPSLVLGGSSAKLITNASSPSKQNILNKLISKTAVFKIPFGSKSVAASEARDTTDTQSLLTGDAATSVKIVKPVVLKPKSPPPPPPATPPKLTPVKKVAPSVLKEASPNMSPVRVLPAMPAKIVLKKVPPPAPPKKPATKKSPSQDRHSEVSYSAVQQEESKEEDDEPVLRSEVEQPLLSRKDSPPPSPTNNASAIPKTGFEFLDNW